MSVVAGYFSSKAQRLATEAVRERISDYSILPSERREGAFHTDVRQIRFGHLISKYKAEYHHQMPTVADQNGNVLMISGYLFPPDADEASAGQRLLSLCVETHGKVLEACEGEFVALFAEGRSGGLHIVNDRFGACPFFFLNTDGRSLFSSNLAFLRFLAGARLESDILGWLQIVSWDHAVGSRTHLRDVRRLLPASHVLLSSEAADYKQYWRPTPMVDHRADPAGMARRVFAAFRGATQRRTEWLGKGMIALSGGIDSRLVAGGLPEGADFSGWTFVDSVDVTDTPQISIASQVSRILGLRHTIKPIPTGVLSPQLARDIIALTGGLIAVQHSAKTMQGISVMKEEGLDAQMGGAAGESLSGGYVRSPDDVDPTKTEECLRGFVRSMAGPGRADLLGRIFRQDVLREHRPLLTSSLTESLAAVEGPTAAHRASVWKLVNRNFGFTFVCPTHGHPDVTEAQPHLGYGYTDLMLQLPARWLYRRAFYQFMIFQCLPSLRDVIYANTGQRLSGRIEPNPDRDRRWEAYYRLRRFVRRSVRPSAPAPRREQTFLHDLLHNAQLYNEVIDMIRSRPRLTEVLDAEKCLQFVADCRDGRLQGESSANVARLLGVLTTMAYAFDHFDRPGGAQLRLPSPSIVA